MEDSSGALPIRDFYTGIRTAIGDLEIDFNDNTNDAYGVMLHEDGTIAIIGHKNHRSEDIEAEVAYHFTPYQARKLASVLENYADRAEKPSWKR